MSVYVEIAADNPQRVTVAVQYRHRELVKQLPGARYDRKDNVWYVPKSWAQCLALRTQFGTELEIGPALTIWAQEEYQNRIVPCMNLRQSLDAEGSPSLYGYQRAGVQFMATARQALLADEMGTGKSRQAIMALQQLYVNGEDPFPCLIVAPNSTKISWKREAETVWPGIQVNVVSGSMASRRKALTTQAHIYVMNWEMLRGHSRLAPYGSIALQRCVECGGTDSSVTITKCEVHPRELNEIKFNSVIADECHRGKNPASKQTRALWAATGDAEFRFGLSGTPIANAIDDLWTILHWLSPDEWPSKVKFVDRFCDVSYNAFGAATVIGVKHHMKNEFFAAVDPRLRRMPKELVLSHLPPVLYERRDVEMLPKQAKAYHTMRDRMVAELEDNDQYVTTDPRIRFMRMLQFASSYAELQTRQNRETGEDEEFVRLIEPSSKISAFMDDLDDFGDDSVVVFAVSSQLINLLSARLTKAKISHGLITGAQNTEQRQQHMDDFQAGRTKYILCTIAAGGTGITLTRARVAVFLQRSYSMVDNNQAEARIHRIGSEIHESVVIIDYTTADTVEETVIQIVADKNKRLESILRDKELMKAMLVKNRVEIPETEMADISG